MSNEKQGRLYLRDDKNTEIVLNIKRENITTERNFKITEQEMYSNNGKHHRTNFYDNGDDGLSFACTIVFTKNDVNVMKRLDNWPLYQRSGLSLNSPINKETIMSLYGQ